MKHFFGWETLLVLCLAAGLGCETSGDSGSDNLYSNGDSTESEADSTTPSEPREGESDDNRSSAGSDTEDEVETPEDTDSPPDTDKITDTTTDSESPESDPIDTATELDSADDVPDTSDSATETDTESDRATEEGQDTETDISVTDDQDIFPLAKGNIWTYKVTSLGSNTACRAGTSSSQIDRRAIEKGKYSTYRFKGFCKKFGSQSEYDFLYPNGDVVINYDTGDVVTDSPVSEGHQWKINTEVTVQWEFVGQATVPAGSFDNCWNRVPLDHEDKYPLSTYCRGIGPIKVLWPGRTEAVLLSYTASDTN